MPSHDCDCCHFFHVTAIANFICLGGRICIYFIYCVTIVNGCCCCWCSSCFRFHFAITPGHRKKTLLSVVVGFHANLTLWDISTSSVVFLVWTLQYFTDIYNFTHIVHTLTRTPWTECHLENAAKKPKWQRNIWEKNGGGEKKENRIETFSEHQNSAGDEWQLHCWISLLIMEHCRHWTPSIHSSKSKTQQKKSGRTSRMKWKCIRC